MNQFHKIEQLIIKLADEAYRGKISELSRQIHQDGVDVSTQFDDYIEEQFHRYIVQHYPDYNFIGEEIYREEKKSEYTWVIDPIDGTKYFAKGIPLWTTTIALIHNNEIVYGLVYYPTEKILYTAEQNKGAYKNGQIVSCQQDSKIKTISQQIINLQCTHYNNQLKDIIVSLYENCYRVRSIGSGALSIMWLLEGGFDMFLNLTEADDKLIDTAAAKLIIKESGLELMEFKNIFGSNTIYCGNKIGVEYLSRLLEKLKVNQG